MRILFTAVLIILMPALAGCGGDEQEAVTYEVSFQGTWSSQTHPQDFPADAHFSGLIGAVHNENVTFWQVGQPASPGIRNMAETGGKDPLSQEIDEALDKGVAFEKISGGGIDSSPGSVHLTFQVDEEFPFVSLVSMIAPSPDWFVGVDTLSLREDGGWVDSKVVELYAYDAGTDSGASYGSPDEASEPPLPIAGILDGVVATDGIAVPLGTFTFTRVE